MIKRVIITGATGFVGANLTRRLLREGHEVHALVRQGYTPWRIQPIRADIRLYETDFTDQRAVARVVAGIRPEWVFHLAADDAYASEANIHGAVAANIIGTINLVEACLRTGFEAFINTGTSQEYGFKDHPPCETESVEPHNHHAVTKVSATLYCRYMAQRCRVHLSTLRPYSVYGPYEQPKRLLPTLIMKGLNGQLPQLVNPDIGRDMIYVEDVNDAYLLAATQPHQELGAIYNLGTGVQTSLREIVDMARRTMGITVEPAWNSLTQRQWDTDVWVANSRKIQRELGWKPRYTFEKGFRLMVDWFRDNPAIRDIYSQYYKQAAETEG